MLMLGKYDDEGFMHYGTDHYRLDLEVKARNIEIAEERRVRAMRIQLEQRKARLAEIRKRNRRGAKC